MRQRTHSSSGEDFRLAFILMDTKNQDSRYLIKWICVIVTGAIVFVGWLWVIRHNIDRTNEELSQGVGSMDQMTVEMQKMFNEMSAELKKTEAPLDVPVPPAETPVPTSTTTINLEIPAVNVDKK